MSKKNILSEIDYVDLADNITLRFFRLKDSRGKYLDNEPTVVKINGNVLCYIAWKDFELFKKELKAVINKYRI